MPTSAQEFVILDIAWPQAQEDKFACLRGLHVALWCRHPGIAAVAEAFGTLTDRIVLDTAAGRRAYEIWLCGQTLLIFKEQQPPTLIIVATPAAAEGQVTSAFRLLSGRPLAEAAYELEPAEPLLMGHLTLAGYRAASEAGLVESVYQDVKVLIDGFQDLIPDGVALWGAFARLHAAPEDALAASLAWLRRRSPRELQALNNNLLPDFLEPNLHLLQLLPVSARRSFWTWYVHGFCR